MLFALCLALIVCAVIAAPPRLLNIHEVADVLGVSPRTVYAITYPRGTLRCVKAGLRGIRYSPRELERWIAEQEGRDCPDFRSADSSAEENTGEE
jgi:hypothetical protein